MLQRHPAFLPNCLLVALLVLGEFTQRRVIVKNSEPDNFKNNLPDSDQTARRKNANSGEWDVDDVSSNIEGLQTSSKSGKHSAVEKLAASRPEFGDGRGAQHVPGAFADDPSHVMTGREASPDTNRFRCSGCGRYLNTAGELSAHEPECRLAKAATNSGRKACSTRTKALILEMMRIGSLVYRAECAEAPDHLTISRSRRAFTTA